MARVSICLPTYNGERFLAEAIESVLAQTYSDFELLISDDCSTDSTAEIASTYANQDSRINFWRNDVNKGLFGNYNECMNRARGEFIKPFAQDDVLSPTMVARCVELLEGDPTLSLISTARKWIDSEGNETGVIRPFRGNEEVAGRDVITYNLIRATNWVGEPSTVMFRRANAGSGFDEDYYHFGDIEYWFRQVQCGRYYYVDEVLCSFRRHSGSATSANLSGMFFALDILRLNKQYASYLRELGESEEQTMSRSIEIIALHIDHLVRTQKLSIADVLSLKGARNGGDDEDFKELSFWALRYVTQLLATHDDLKCRSAAEREHLQAQLNDMRASTSWRITAPLRSLAGGQ